MTHVCPADGSWGDMSNKMNGEEGKKESSESTENGERRTDNG